MKRWEVINTLIQKFNYKSYLEIGVRNGDCFSKVNVDYKTGVDPDPTSKATLKMTSDEFFEKPRMLWDIIFIDGLHESDQVYRDINNALKYLTPGGIIVLHDCNPQSFEAQAVPRQRRVWNGDVWKAFVQKRIDSCGEIEMFTIDTDEGLGIIYPKKEGLPLFLKDEGLSYQGLENNRKIWLRLISVEDFQTWLKQQ